MLRWLLRAVFSTTFDGPRIHHDALARFGVVCRAVALVVRFIAMIPAFRYQDLAIVTIDPWRAKSSENDTSPPAQAEPSNGENEKVFSH